MNTLNSPPHLQVDRRAIVPAVLWGGYGLKMTHDLANELTTLSALQFLIERENGNTQSLDWVPRAVSILEIVTKSIASRVHSFNALRESLVLRQSTLTGKAFLERLEEMLQPQEWRVECTCELPPHISCYPDLLSVCIAALQEMLCEPLNLTICSLPTALTGGRPALTLSLGNVKESVHNLVENDAFVATQQLILSMGGFLEMDKSLGETRVRVSLPRSS